MFAARQVAALHAVSEITAACHDHIAARLRAAGLGALAGLGFTGLDPDSGDPVIITGYKSTRAAKTTPAQRQANQALSAARAPVEHGFSDLKHWRCNRNPGQSRVRLVMLAAIPAEDRGDVGKEPGLDQGACLAEALAGLLVVLGCGEPPVQASQADQEGQRQRLDLEVLLDNEVR